MTSGNSSPEFPLIVRPDATPSVPDAGLPAVRPPGEVRLSTVALATGLALTFEAVRLAARFARKRTAARKVMDTPTQVTISYEWTQITFARRERS